VFQASYGRGYESKRIVTEALSTLFCLKACNKPVERNVRWIHSLFSFKWLESFCLILVHLLVNSCKQKTDRLTLYSFSPQKSKRTGIARSVPPKLWYCGTGFTTARITSRCVLPCARKIGVSTIVLEAFVSHKYLLCDVLLRLKLNAGVAKKGQPQKSIVCSVLSLVSRALVGQRLSICLLMQGK